MRTMTATEASRNFSAVLTAVSSGETILVTRDGRPVARIEPETRTAADRLIEVLERYGPTRVDPGDEDPDRVRREIAAILTDDEIPCLDD